MPRIVWDPKPYLDNGVDQGVLYPEKGPGLPWNGLTAARISTDRAEISSYFLDGVKYARSTDDGVAAGSITAFTYPSNLDLDDRSRYGLCYRVMKGATPDLGYRLHIFYNTILLPGERTHISQTNGSSLSTFEWSLTTLPSLVSTYQPSAHFIIDSETTYPWMLKAIESVLYGDDDNDPRLPSVDELLDMFEQYSILIITDHGDGRFSAEGPDNVVPMVDEKSFHIDWFSAIPKLDSVYEVRTA